MVSLNMNHEFDILFLVVTVAMIISLKVIMTITTIAGGLIHTHSYVLRGYLFACLGSNC